MKAEKKAKEKEEKLQQEAAAAPKKAEASQDNVDDDSADPNVSTFIIFWGSIMGLHNMLTQRIDSCEP